MLSRTVLPFVALLLILGCSHQQAPSQMAQPTLAPATAPQSAQRERTLSARATVVSVDQTTREVRLRTMDGSLLSVVAGPEVRNLDQVAPGDVVQMTYYESVVARMAEPGSGGEPAATSFVASRAPEGGTPAGLVRRSASTVVEFVAYDPTTAIATLKAPDGTTRRVLVSPSMRSFAAARHPGDRVAVQVSDSLAVSIVKATGAMPQGSSL